MASRYRQPFSGTPTAEPKRITQWAGNYLSAFTASADGKRLVLQKETEQSQVYLAELTAGGKRINLPVRLTNDEAFEEPTGWLPDSKAVLFQSTRNGTLGIFKQGISQENPEPLVGEPHDALASILSADGASILFVERPRTSDNRALPDRLMRVSVKGGVPQFVMELADWSDYSCAHSPASLCLIVEVSHVDRSLIVSAFDPLKGREEVLRTFTGNSAHPYAEALELSPDASMLAIARRGFPEIHISLFSLSGGSDREFPVRALPSITA